MSRLKDFNIRVYYQGTMYDTFVQAETVEEAKEIARKELYEKYVTGEQIKTEEND